MSYSKMLRIGYFIPEFPSQTHIFFWREINALRSLGVDVHIFSTKKPNLNNIKHDFVKEAVAETFYVFPPNLRSSLFYCIGSFGWVLKCLLYILYLEEASLLQRFRCIAMIPSSASLLACSKKYSLDHIHVHSCANSAHLVAMASLSGQIQYSLTLHGSLETYGVDHASKMKRALFVATVTKQLSKQVSEDVFPSPKRLPVIWMGVDTKKFLAPNVSEGYTSNELRLITVARLNEGKGHIFAINAIYSLIKEGYSISYKIVGGGDFKDKIQERIQDLGLESNVKLFGTLGEEDVRVQIQESDVFLLTSCGTFEAAPVSLMEAMACGKAAIVSIIGGTPEMITDGKDGLLVPQQDEKAIAEAIRKLADDKNLLLEMGKAARITAEQKFNYLDQAQKLLDQIVCK